MEYPDATHVLRPRPPHRCVENLVDTSMLRQWTGLTREALHARVKAGTLPEPVGTINGGRVWAKEDIDEWFRGMPTVKMKIGRKYRKTHLSRLGDIR